MLAASLAYCTSGLSIMQQRRINKPEAGQDLYQRVAAALVAAVHVPLANAFALVLEFGTSCSVRLPKHSGPILRSVFWDLHQKAYGNAEYFESNRFGDFGCLKLQVCNCANLFLHSGVRKLQFCIDVNTFVFLPYSQEFWYLETA